VTQENTHPEAAMEKFLNESPELAQARQNGIDVWALWANLHRTPAERLRRHEIAFKTMSRLRKAKKVENEPARNITNQKRQ
jgi:hypothetical protein